jgi:hypothetical protein
MPVRITTVAVVLSAFFATGSFACSFKCAPERNQGAGRLANPLISLLPFIDTYRTLCLAPPFEIRRLFQDLRGVSWKA